MFEQFVKHGLLVTLEMWWATFDNMDIVRELYHLRLVEFWALTSPIKKNLGFLIYQNDINNSILFLHHVIFQDSITYYARFTHAFLPFNGKKTWYTSLATFVCEISTFKNWIFCGSVSSIVQDLNFSMVCKVYEFFFYCFELRILLLLVGVVLANSWCLF